MSSEHEDAFDVIVNLPSNHRKGLEQSNATIHLNWLIFVHSMGTIVERRRINPVATRIKCPPFRWLLKQNERCAMSDMNALLAHTGMSTLPYIEA